MVCWALTAHIAEGRRRAAEKSWPRAHPGEEGVVPTAAPQHAGLPSSEQTRLQDLDEAARKYLAWESILSERVQLDLTPLQAEQADTQKGAADGAVTARLPETSQWLLVPVQENPAVPGHMAGAAAVGAGCAGCAGVKKLRNDELLITSFASSRLRMELERIPLWRGDHVPISLLLQDFRNSSTCRG